MALDKPELETEKNQDTEMPVGASLKENTVEISSPEGVEEFSLKGYGTKEEGKLSLTLYEALFLLGKGTIEIKDEKTGKKIAFQELLKRF